MHVEESIPTSTTFKCGSCGYKSEDEIDMNEHIKSKPVIKCKICDKTEKAYMQNSCVQSYTRGFLQEKLDPNKLLHTDILQV